MLNGKDGANPRSGSNEDQTHPRTLTLEMPDIEDIARVIWQRQHDALDSNSNARHWRDQTIPSRFWDEFLLDAHAVLSLLQKEHVKFQKKRAATRIGSPSQAHNDYSWA
jgi:hypothetical protein